MVETVGGKSMWEERRKKGEIGKLKNRNRLMSDCTDDVNHHALISSSTLLTAGAIT